MIIDLQQIKLKPKPIVMKKHLLYFLTGFFLIMLSGFQHTIAQDKKTSTISITITEDDKVTTDTTFELKEGQDPETIKKMITHLAGDDMQVKHMSKDVVWHTKPCMESINIDSIKEAHEGARVLVIKNKDGDVTVEEKDMHGKHHEIMKEHKVIIHTDVDDDCKGLEKKIEVIISGDEGDENVDVIILKQDDCEEVKVITKKVRVVIEDEEDGKEEVVKKKKKK